MVEPVRRARALRWAIAITAIVASAGLVALTMLKDLNTVSLVASVVGAIAGIAGAVFAALPLLRQPDSDTGSGTRRVRASRGAIAAGGDITGSALGSNSKVSGPPTSRRPTKPDQGNRDIQAGRDGVAAGGDITDSAIGDGSTRE